MTKLARPVALLAALLSISSHAAGSEAVEPVSATKEEYFACLEAGDSIEEKKSKLSERQETHKELAAKFQAAERDLAAQVKRHPPSTKPERDSYNRAIAKRNVSADAFNLESRRIQLDQRALNSLITSTNASCSALLVSHDVATAVEEMRNSKVPKK